MLRTGHVDTKKCILANMIEFFLKLLTILKRHNRVFVQGEEEYFNLDKILLKSFKEQI